LALRPIYAVPGFSIMATQRKSSTRKKIQRTRTQSKSRSRTAVRKKKKETPRYVYYFGDGHADGAGTMKPLLGGKGANLHEMTRIGLPVPPGFTIDTEVCTYFYDHNRSYPPQLEAKVAAALAKLENQWEKNSATKTGRCSSRCVRVRAIRCQ